MVRGGSAAPLAALLAVSLLPHGGAVLPDYGPPSFGALSARCPEDGPACRGTVCDWLNLVAFKGGFGSLGETRRFLDARLDTISASSLAYLRMPASLLAAIKANYSGAECEFAPRSSGFRPWRRAIDGSWNSPNHMEMVNTSSDGVSDGVFVGNVYAPVPGAETYHVHPQVSIFVHYGAPPCQVGVAVDGSYEASGADCVNTTTLDTPKTLEVLFTGPQWLHTNFMLPPMAFENARNCPHELAPSHYGKRGFMLRIFIPMNDTDVLYPPAPITAPYGMTSKSASALPFLQ